VSEKGGQPSVCRSQKLGNLHRPQKSGEIVPEVGTLEDPDEGIRTTDGCVVQHHSKAKEGNGDFELFFEKVARAYYQNHIHVAYLLHYVT